MTFALDEFEHIPFENQDGNDSSSNHHLFMLNNGLHLDLDKVWNFEFDLTDVENNVAAKNRKLE